MALIYTVIDMDVLMMPDYSSGNPYQRQLGEVLESNGVSVTLSKGESFTVIFDGFRVLPVLGCLYQERPAILHLHWVYPFTIGPYRWLTLAKGVQFLFELLAARLFGVTIVWTVHNLWEHERRSPRLDRFYRRVIVRFCDRIVVHCESAREQVVDAYDLSARQREKITVIPHGNYVECYPEETSRDEARSQLGLDHDETVFLYFGRIREYKNVPELVTAFKRLDTDDARLLVVGNPRNKAVADRITARIGPDDNIKTEFSFVPEDEVQVYMRAADVVTLPFSDLLTSGSTMLAMSFGKPVVVPGIGCVDELITGDCGFTFDPGADGDLQATLERALEADLETVGRNNYERATAFSWDPIGDETAKMYRSVVG